MLDGDTEQCRRPHLAKASSLITDRNKHAGDGNGLVSGSLSCCVPQKDGFTLEETLDDHPIAIFTKYIGGVGCLERAAAMACDSEMWKNLGQWLQNPELRTDRHGVQRKVFFFSTRKLFVKKS